MHMSACVQRICSGIYTTAAEHWKQEVGSEPLKKVQGVLKVSCFCNPVHELLPFLPIVPLTTRDQMKTDAHQHRCSAALQTTQQLKKTNDSYNNVHR